MGRCWNGTARSARQSCLGHVEELELLPMKSLKLVSIVALLLMTPQSQAKKRDPSDFTLKARITGQGKTTSPGIALPPACTTCGSVITRRHENTVSVEILSFPQSGEAKDYETIGDSNSKQLTLGATYPATFEKMNMLILLPDGKVAKLKVQSVRLKAP
jgi:hypothetical protein